MERNALALWPEWPEFRGLCDSLRKRSGELAAYGLSPAAQAGTLAALARETSRPILVLTPDWDGARVLSEHLSAWLGEEAVALLPPADFVVHGVAAQSRELAASRLQALARARQGTASLVVAPVASALRRFLPVGAWDASIRHLKVGQTLDLDEFAAHLVSLGYEPAATVETPGSFARRGGLIDVYPLFGPGPLRVELFDDEVESIRLFDPSDQRSTGELEEAAVHPAREAVADAARRERAARAVEEEARDRARRLEGGPEGVLGRRLLEEAGRLAERLRSEGGAAWEVCLGYLYDDLAWLPDYLGPDVIVVLQEPVRMDEEARALETARAELVGQQVAEGRVLSGQLKLLPDWADLKTRLRAGQVLLLSNLPRHPRDFEPRASSSLTAHEIPPFHGQEALLRDELRRWSEGGYRTLVCTGNAERARRLADDLASAGIEATRLEADAGLPAPPPGAIWIVPVHLPHGAVWPGMRLVVVGEADVAGPAARPARRRATRTDTPGAVRVSSIEDLRVGDYVVHAHHGIGQYLGTRAMTVQGVRRDYLLIKYEGQDRLYVPTDQIDLVQRYVGGGDARPRLNRLGGGEWQRTKQRVKESVQHMAEELLELYAARQALRGHAFAPDTAWQREFEDAFPYEETPDQLRAIAEVKADMESPRPMDRLLCGDVGYGKTEVAIRAAFKAVMDGRQVAVLVPTTILAEQHYLTFTERFAGFPVEIRMLSRFRSPAEQARTVTGLRTGEVDVVIGTHRLVQEDVAFKNLGLLIIDEEHRFGVAHKERLKQMRRTVDVLTLTATPIPRTLHMAMAGLRDLSVIETPPANRYPVETYVVEMDDTIVREAIRRELARGGQVFYLHNHVRSIRRAQARLAELVPEADIVIAHGQMEEEELERVMVEFLRGRHDVLLCTTIIESGLDIPNANTLIVEDADRLGLAQLYQIRGRVGRSDRLAYAYFTFRPQKVLSEVAEQRLAALRDFTELGSGLRVAMRDLEIRGAGNILGPEQHGFMVQVGFEMYTQLLEEAVRELKGERRAPETRTSVELAVDAHLPDDYVASSRHKLEFYKKINAIASLADADAVRAELEDRFGPPPAPAMNLLSLARLRVRAAELGALGLSQEGPLVRLGFPGFMADLLAQAAPVKDRFRRRLQIELAPRPAVTLRLEDPARPLAETAELLDALAEVPALRRWHESATVPV